MSEHRAFPKSVQAGIPKLGPKPPGWKTYALGDLLKVVERPVRLNAEKQYQLVTAKRNRGGIVERGRLTGRSIKTKSQFLAKSGDFLISRRQIAHGACGIVPSSLDNAVVSNEYATLQPTDRLDIDFLKHLTNTIYFQQTCFHSSIGVHVEKLVFNLEHWMTWQFHLPPVPEQRRIAAILDEWDNAIVTAKKLVDTKLNRANKIRRAVFADIADDVVPLCDLADCATGVSAPQAKSAFSGSGPRFVRVNDLASFAGEKPDEPEYLAEEFVRNARIRLFPAGTVLFAKSGMSAKLDRVVQLPEAAYIVSHLGAVVARNEAYQQYVFHWLSENPPSSLLQGDGFPSLRISEIAELEIPDVGEEQAGLIGEALDQSFDSVRSERRRLSLLERQKRALMQKLLSGDWPVPASIDRLLPGGQEIDEAVGAEVRRAEATG